MNTLSIIHTYLFPFQLVFRSVRLFIPSIMGKNSSRRLAVAAFTPPKSGESGVVPKSKVCPKHASSVQKALDCNKK